MMEFALTILFLSAGRHGDVEFKRYEQMVLAANTIKADAPPHLLPLTSPLIFSQRNNYLLAGQIAGESEESKSMIRKEMSVYPKSLLAWTNLKLVLLCRTLYIGGLAHIEPYQAISVPTQDSLLINISGPAVEVKASVHHELFHFIDYRCGFLLWDVEWSWLNDPSFSYGAPAPNSLLASPSGFVSHYATSDASEDKAETFVKMITEPEVIERLVRNDRVIYSKVKCLRTRLVTICPEMNQEFWDLILKRRVEQLRVEQTRHELLLPHLLSEENVVPERQTLGPTMESLNTPIKLLFVGLVSGSLLWVIIHLRGAKK